MIVRGEQDPRQGTAALDHSGAGSYSLRMLTPEDTDLAARIRTGEHAAFTELVNRYADPALRVAHRFLHSRDTALDCVQEMFTRVWANHERFAPTISLRSYVIGAARHEAMMMLRHRERRPDLRESIAVPVTLQAHGEESTVIDRATADALVQTLPERQRLAVHLRFTEQLPYAEIGDVLDISPGAAEQLVIRAIAALRNHIKNRS